MKKFVIILIVMVFLLASCSSYTVEEKTALQQDIDRMRSTTSQMESEIVALTNTRDTLVAEIDNTQHIINGDIPIYILTLELKQKHFSLDLAKHLKDEVNAVEFSIPVSKAFYDAQNIGDELVDEFRAGSFWTEGSIGTWTVTVTDKEIGYE